jgi:hypothetical protein
LLIVHGEDALRARGTRLPNWEPRFPEGRLETLYLHWTAGDYRTAYASYHFCLTLDEEGVPVVCATHDLRANMRELTSASEGYAAHTFGRNSFAVGVAVAGMLAATPHDFGAYPLRDDLLDATCAVVKRLCVAYAIPVEAGRVRTHAEAALDDGYFGAGDEQRWDIARLAPSPHALAPHEALATGELLRARVRAA